MSGPRARFWLVTVATAATMAVTASLGFWQLDRAAQKLALQAQMDQRSRLPAWTVADLLQATSLQAGLHRPVRLAGRWVRNANVFLDNRQMNGRVGFFVLTPLRLAGSERAVLVQRGWVPRDFADRTRVPDVPTPEADIVLSGRLAPPPGQLFDLGDEGTGAIRQNVNLPSLSMQWGVPLLPGVSVLQTGGAEAAVVAGADDQTADGLLRDWPVVSSGVQKHHGYAFQWFGLCLLAALLYLWFQFIAPRRKQGLHGIQAR